MTLSLLWPGIRRLSRRMGNFRLCGQFSSFMKASEMLLPDVLQLYFKIQARVWGAGWFPRPKTFFQ